MGSRQAEPIAVLALAAALECGAADAQSKPSQPQTGAGDKSTVGAVTVAAPPQSAPRTSIDRRSYQIGKDVGSGTLADALRNIPSVLVDPLGNLSIRGDSNVTILVDGKPSSLFTGPGRTQALQTLPADEFERVEVITNPSAEFTPEGTGGIINLISRKTRRPGVSGSVQANVFSNGRANAGLNANRKGEKLTLTLNANFNRNAVRTDWTDLRQALNTGSVQGTTLQQGHQGVSALSGYMRVGADYDIDAATRLSGAASYFDARSVTRTRWRLVGDDQAGALDQVFDRAGAAHNDNDFLSLESSARHAFAGEAHDVTIAAQASLGHYRSSSLFTDASALPPLPDLFDRQRSTGTLLTTDLKVDYERPAPMGAQLKAGFEAKGEMGHATNDGILGAPTPNAPLDPGQTDRFHFGRWIEAGYLTYQQPFGKLTALAGLRLERSDIRLEEPTIDFRFSSGDFHVFPTLHLAYSLGGGAQLIASYSERIRRPDPQQFDPFQRVTTPFDISAGNPRLRPATTQSVELGYDYKRNRDDLRATLYFHENRGQVAQAVTDLGGGVLFSQTRNVLASEGAGLDFEAGGRITKTLTYNVSAIVGWSRIDARPLGLPSPREGESATGHGQLDWQPTSADLLQLYVQAASRVLLFEGAQRPWFYAAVGWRHTLTPQLSVLLTVQDVFGPYASITDTPTLLERYRADIHAGAAMLGVTYTFGAGAKKEPGFDFTPPPSS